MSRICAATRTTPNKPTNKTESVTLITGRYCRHRHPVKKDAECQRCKKRKDQK